MTKPTLLLTALLLIVMGANAQNFTFRNAVYTEPDTSTIDTLPVHMLVTTKQPGPAMYRKGYSVGKRNGIQVKYLDQNKASMSDFYIIWMSVRRKEDCKCD